MKRLFLFALLLAILADSGALAAELTVVVRYDASQEAFLRSAMADVQKEYPGVELAVTNGGSDKVQALIAAGMAPELQLIGFETFGQFASQGVMYDVNPLLRRSNLRLDDFFPAAQQIGKWGSNLYAIPFNIKIPVVFVNKSMFSNAGLPLPTKNWLDPAWSLDAYYSVAKKLTVDKNGDGELDQYGLQNISHYEELTSTGAFGARWVSEGETAFSGDSEAMRRAMRFWAEVNQNAVGGDYLRGTAAMWVNLVSQIPRILPTGIEWDIAALPYQMPLYLSADAWRFYQGREMEAAWAFVRRISFDARRSADGAAVFSGIPSSRKAFDTFMREGLGLAKLLNQEQKAMVLQGLGQRATGIYGGPVYFEEFLRKRARDIYLRVLKGEIHPDQAIEEARAAFTSLTRK